MPWWLRCLTKLAKAEGLQSSWELRLWSPAWLVATAPGAGGGYLAGRPTGDGRTTEEPIGLAGCDLAEGLGVMGLA